MRNVLKRFWFPALIVCFIAIQTVGMSPLHYPGDPGCALVTASPSDRPDTIEYKNQFIGKVLSVEEEDTSVLSLVQTDTTPRLTARDTIFPPDSLRDTDPFRYKYYVALLDSATHIQVRDSLRQAGDSLDWPRIDSLYSLDSAIRKKAAFDAWYAGLSKEERKKYEFNKKMVVMKHMADSIQNVKDSIKNYKDSIRENVPRILETYAFPDSMLYKRIVTWTPTQEFHEMDVQPVDTSYNYHFHDYPIFRNDVNATWLGVAGSAAQYYDFFKRESQNGVSFYDPYEAWTFSPKNVPMYNTKTPYTELAYYGTLFAPTQRSSDNLHILTTQNLFPQFNFTLEYDRFGGGGILENETTNNKTFLLSANYLGKRYVAHGGYIYNMVSRKENGGITDNTMVRDTTLDAREFPVLLNNASTRIKKNTVFFDQQYRIPFTFLKNLKYHKEIKADKHYKDSILALGDTSLIRGMMELLAEHEAAREEADTTGDKDVTTAFIGHSSEYSVFTRTYSDIIQTSALKAREFYGGNFLLNPVASNDSSRVMKLENRAFLRLQPWSDDAIVSRIGGGIGNRILSYSVMDPSFLRGTSNETWNSTYVYAGAEGQLKEYVHWNASGDFVLLGEEAGDMSLKADARLNIYPFRKARKSPIVLGGHFETSLDEPEFYSQHYISNHYRWDNDFGKVSTTKIKGSISIPRWKVGIDVGYALLNGNLYHDTTAIIRQNDKAMSVLSASLKKNFVFGPVHLDNRILFQASSNQDVVPVPTLAANARWYLQLNPTKNVLQIQIGADTWWNTKYYSPGWNPAVGAFYNQKVEKYNNGPFIDAFVNMQWKRACIFVKMENAGMGWPMERADYFSAHHFIRTQRALKFGICWPFYKQPAENKAVQAGGSMSSSKATSGVNAPRSPRSNQPVVGH